MFKKVIFVLVLISVCFFRAEQSASADIAPPNYPPGSNIGTEGQTQVKMVSEKVVFDFTYMVTSNEPPVDNMACQFSGCIYVTADFLMLNLGDVEENLEVRFPLSGFYEDMPDVTFKSYVNGVFVENEFVFINPPPEVTDTGMPEIWVVFPVTFPANQPVLITVQYELDPSGYEGALSSGYTLETGAGWKDDIDLGEFIIRMPYLAEEENITVSWESSLPLKTEYIGNEVRWEFHDLEPGRRNNLRFIFLPPDQWINILQAGVMIKAHPGEAAGYLLMADAYHSMSYYSSRESHGNINKNRVTKALGFYKDVLTIEPYSLEANLNIAVILWSLQSGISIFSTSYRCPSSPDIASLLPYLGIANALDPQGEIEDLLYGIKVCVGENGIQLPTYAPGSLPTLTITPTSTRDPNITATKTITRTPTERPILPKSTRRPSATVTPQPSPTESPEVVTATPVPPADSSQVSLATVIVIAFAAMLIGAGIAWYLAKKKV